MIGGIKIFHGINTTFDDFFSEIAILMETKKKTLCKINCKLSNTKIMKIIKLIFISIVTFWQCSLSLNISLSHALFYRNSKDHFPNSNLYFSEINYILEQH